MFNRAPTVLHVFISSPGDCAPERDLVEQTLAVVNALPVARQANIVLEALRWERLPPGATDAHDYQRRIDGLLAKVDLDRFEIYLGFMKHRAGTPTPRHASGTIEEFETALERKRRTGLPAEVSFYFLAPLDAMQPDAAAFRRSLGERGFLYADASEPGQFPVLLRAHLEHVVLGWRQWKNRLRRQLRNVKSAGVALACLVLLGLAAAEGTTLYQIGQALERQQQESAVRIWNARGRYLPVTRVISASRIREALVAVAASKLVDSLSAQGYEPFTWKRKHLRPFEAAALIAHARQALASASTHGQPRNLLSLVALAEDWGKAAALATESARLGRIHDAPEVRGFMLNAPAGRTVDWLQRGLPDGMAPHVAGTILRAGAERSEPAVTFHLLEALRQGRLGEDAKRFDLEMSCDGVQRGCTQMANATLVRWIHDGEALPLEALRLLITWAAPGNLAPGDRLGVERRLLQLFKDESFSDVSPAMIGFLARFESAKAQALLRNRVRLHADGNIGFGFAERKALIDAIPALAMPDGDRRALAIAKRSAEEAASLRGPFKPHDGPVQASYLHLLGKEERIDWQRHKGWIATLLERRLNGDFSGLFQADFDHGFSALLSRTDSQQFIDLFGTTAAGIVDSWDGTLSTRRVYLLGQLPKEQGPLPEPIVEAVCRAVPVDETNRAHFLETLARHGGPVGKACLLGQLDAKDIEYRALSGDARSLMAQLRAGLARSGEAWKALLNAARRLPPEPQRQFLVAALPLASASEQPDLLTMARSLDLSTPQFIALATSEISSSQDPRRMAAAIDYLGIVKPDEVWRTLRQPAVTARFVDLMKRCEEFDWIQVAQALPDSASSADVPVLANLLERRFLLVLDASRVGERDWIAERKMSVRDKVVSNPLWRLMALQGGTEVAKALLQFRSSATGTVHAVEKLPGKDAAYRAYMDWLLGEVVARLEMPERGIVPASALYGWLDDSDPVSVRAAAGLTLAVLTQAQLHR